MGIYNYFLTTKTKKIKVGGVRQDFHLTKYAYKDGWGAPTSRVLATEGRIERAWSERAEGPRYVTSEHIDDGSYVWTDLPVKFPSLMSENYLSHHARVAGIFRKDGDALVFKPVSTYRIPLRITDRYNDDYWSNYHAQIKEIRDHVGNDTLVFANEFSGHIDVLAEDDGTLSVLRLLGYTGEIMTGARTPEEYEKAKAGAN